MLLAHISTSRKILFVLPCMDRAVKYLGYSFFFTI